MSSGSPAMLVPRRRRAVSRGNLGALSKRLAFAVPHVVSIVAIVFATVPVVAGSDEEILPNQTGDDPTQPLGKVELLDRFTTAPGPGAVQGTTKQVDTNTPFVRMEAPFRIAPQWELAFRVEIPVVSTNGVIPKVMPTDRCGPSRAFRLM
jgi:hypothetical protein